VAVAVDGLDAALLVEGADAVPGRDRVGDDVPPIDDREAVANEERGPVGDQLGPAVVQDSYAFSGSTHLAPEGLLQRTLQSHRLTL
jgi:hypothetical protein